jgi:predicted Fe-S protein YdhL (DUF1289 family)
MSIPDPPKATLSPCIGVCALDIDGLCAGCHRTAGEIARWMYYSDAERLQLMNDVLPRRASLETRK